jgi:hypothetical protein
MPSRSYSTEIAGSPEAIFDLLHDYDRRLEWDPFLRQARLLGGATEAGPGVRTLCVARLRAGGAGMETVYVSFCRPTLAAVRMTRGPWFLSTFAASLRQETVAARRTRVTYTVSLRGRPWLLTPVLYLVFGRETRQRLRALKHYMEATADPAASRASQPHTV